MGLVESGRNMREDAGLEEVDESYFRCIAFRCPEDLHEELSKIEMELKVEEMMLIFPTRVLGQKA